MKKMMLAIVMIALLSMVYGEWEIQEDFESGAVPTGWTVIDDDGDGNQFNVLNDEEHAHSGTHALFCQNMFPNENEDWIILPQFTVEEGDSLHFYTRSWVSSENLQVLLSTEDPEINDFDYTLLDTDEVSSTYQRYNISLEDYVDQSVYLAFYWECDTYGILIDDILVGSIDSVLPEIELPESFTFVQGEGLVVDLSTYITNAQPDNAELTVSGNTEIDAQIDDFEVTFTSADWYGTETLTFSITNENGSDSDDVDVIVEQAPEIDLVAQRIMNPQVMTYLDREMTPALAIRNDGTGAMTASFDVSCLIIDSLEEVFFEETETCDETIDAGAILVFDFPVSCTPDVEGEYTITFTIDLEDGDTDNNEITADFIVSEHFGESDPDSFGYQWIDSETDDGPTYNWIDISETGASAIMQGVDSFSGDDNFSEPIEFGFDFPFYGTTYPSYYVDTNGELLLSENTWYEPYPNSGWGNDGNVFNWTYPIPGYSQMPGLIAVFWDDLEADEGIGDIYYQTFGSAPDRYCVIQWHDFRFHSGSELEDYLDFEVILYENGDILMQYKNVATYQTGTQAPHDFGQSSTIAIQNEATDVGLCYLRELVSGSIWQGFEPEGNLPHNELAILFYPGVDTQPPFISCEEKGNTFDTSMEFEATIVDMSAIDSATLYYRFDTEWIAVSYDSVDGTLYHFATQQIPQGLTVEYYFEATDENGYTSTLPQGAPETAFSIKTLPTEDVKILLAYSGSQDWRRTEYPVYIDALDDLNVEYDVYDWQEHESYRFPDQYTSIIVYASSGSPGEDSDTLSTALVEYLDSGTTIEPKNVFFSSDGFAYSQSGAPNSDPRKLLLTAYFRTSYIATGIGGGTNGLAGPDYVGYVDGSIVCLNESPIGTPGNEVAVYANSPDCLFEKDACPSWYEDQVQNPQIGSNNAYMFEDGPINGQAYLYHGVCATWIDNLIYKAFYLSFDLSQINSEETRTDMLADALDWFGEDMGETEEAFIPPTSLTLMQNAPNPFNPDTVIQFSLPQDSSVELSVYNVRGRKVKTLCSEPMKAGDHRITWNGTDNNGKPCASGVYLYRIQTQGRSLTKKMILLK